MGSLPDSGNEDSYLITVLGVRGSVSVSGAREHRIAAIAAFQRGRVAWRQLVQAGITGGVVERLVQRSRLHREHRGVYAVGHRAPIPLAAETAALLACSEGAVLSHRAAGALWGFVPPSDREPVHILTFGQCGAHPHGTKLHRTTHLLPRDVRIHRGLPVTSPARTLFDLAGELDDRGLERAVGEAFVQRLVRASQIEEVIDRIPGRRGSAQLRSLISGRPNAVTRSQAEERFLELVRAAGLPGPRVNARILGFELDFAWVEQQLAVEIDGYRFHSSRSAFERDRRRDAILSAAGWRVVRVTWLQMEHEPLAVIARLAQALAQTGA